MRGVNSLGSGLGSVVQRLAWDRRCKCRGAGLGAVEIQDHDVIDAVVLHGRIAAGVVGVALAGLTFSVLRIDPRVGLHIVDPQGVGRRIF